MVDISEEEKKLFVHTKQSLLWGGKEVWVKKGASQGLSDVTLSESCDIVDMFLLSELSHLPIKVGLYRDDLLSVSSLSAREVEKTSQRMREIFRSHGLGLKIEANLKVTDFLDVLLDLKSGTHRAWVKPEHIIHYVHRESNHPAHVLKNIPLEVQRRLTSLSSNQAMFEAAKGPFQDALLRAGYDHLLTYNPGSSAPTTRRRRRRRSILWFNPPFCKSVKTNIGRQFLQLLDRCFPPGHQLHKILNRHTCQLSYRTMPNLGKIVAGHNSKVASPITNLEEKNCNCRGRNAICMMEGSRCMDSGVVYQAEVSAPTKPLMKYVGVCAPDWKSRYRNHKTDFKYSDKRNHTKLAGYVWSLKDEGILHDDIAIKWRILARTSSFRASNNTCRLCLTEKFILMHKPDEATINARDEFFSGCLHKHSLLL